MAYRLEVQAPTRPPEQHELKLGVVSLGSGDLAEVRVNAPNLSPLHLSLEVQLTGVTVRVVDGASSGVLYEGMEQREAAVGWGAEVFVAGVRLSFLADDVVERRTNPLLIAALGAALVVVAWQGAGSAADGDAQGTAVELPSLTPPATPCPEAEPPLATQRARGDELAAHAKQQRYPFDASEGLAALQRLESAAACFDAAGASLDAARTRGERDVFQARLNDDFSALRLRLQLALDHERAADALGAAKAIDELVAPMGETPYRSWLMNVRRRLEQKLARG
jgi:hypothetical protein